MNEFLSNPPTLDRRALVRGAAWSVPVVAIATAAPAYASSTSATCTTGATVAYVNRAWEHPWSESGIQDYLRWNEVTAPGTPIERPNQWEYQNIFTGWTTSGMPGDSSLVAAHDHTKGWEQGLRTQDGVVEDGFVSGADSVRESAFTYTVSYQFPVAGGATYDLSAVVYSGGGALSPQNLAIEWTAPGLAAGRLALLTTKDGWNSPPAGHDSIGAQTVRNTRIEPRSDGLLTVTYTFTLEAVRPTWPASGHETNGDITIKAPTVTTLTCP